MSSHASAVLSDELSLRKNNHNNHRYFLLLLSALLLHGLLWTVTPLFFLPNYHIDTMEMMVIGQNRVIATFKHPAFQGWVVELYSLLTNRSEAAPYLAAQTACLLSVLLVWRFAKEFLPPKYALLAALTLLSYFYFHYDSTVYNNRTFMRFFWLAAVCSLYFALKENKMRYWILTGAALGLGLYCKFTVFILIAVILAFMFLEPAARKYWKTAGPYLSTSVCFILTVPLLLHFLYLPQAVAEMTEYTFTSIGDADPDFRDRFFSPLRFALTQIPILLVLLLPLFPVLGVRRISGRINLRTDFAGRFLTFFIFAPFFVQLVIAFVCAGDMRTALGCHLWLLLPLYLLYMIKIPPERERMFARSAVIVFCSIFLFAALTAISVTISPVLTGKDSRPHFPGKDLAKAVQQIWADRYSSPLPYVRGEDWCAEAVCCYVRPHPVLYSKLWTTEEDFVRKGGILLWLIGENNQIPRHSGRNCYENDEFRYSPATGLPEEEWLALFPNKEILPPLELSPKTIVPVPPIKIGIAVVPPAGVVPAGILPASVLPVVPAALTERIK
ncbi:MAG: glycosyltransferase family 39 protein [Planctomycetaceae bacterium]|jgi:hypothetical protein|nr:glycosyltransferase family 39 protein [Planctomycetaceae bacterium]